MWALQFATQLLAGEGRQPLGTQRRRRRRQHHQQQLFFLLLLLLLLPHRWRGGSGGVWSVQHVGGRGRALSCGVVPYAGRQLWLPTTCFGRHRASASCWCCSPRGGGGRWGRDCEEAGRVCLWVCARAHMCAHAYVRGGVRACMPACINASAAWVATWRDVQNFLMQRAAVAGCPAGEGRGAGVVSGRHLNRHVDSPSSGSRLLPLLPISLPGGRVRWSRGCGEMRACSGFRVGARAESREDAAPACLRAPLAVTSEPESGMPFASALWCPPTRDRADAVLCVRAWCGNMCDYCAGRDVACSSKPYSPAVLLAKEDLAQVATSAAGSAPPSATSAATLLLRLLLPPGMALPLPVVLLLLLQGGGGASSGPAYRSF